MAARQRESDQAQGGDSLPGGRRRQGRFRAGVAVGVFRRSARRLYNYCRERPLNTNVIRPTNQRRTLPVVKGASRCFSAQKRHSLQTRDSAPYEVVLVTYMTGLPTQQSGCAPVMLLISSSSFR